MHHSGECPKSERLLQNAIRPKNTVQNHIKHY